MRIAIHQPNFFPYMGFFQKMDSVDVFCILSNCQFEKNNYQNRFQYNGRWHTMRVSKKIEDINKKEYLEPHYDWNKIKRGIKTDLSYFDACINESLFHTNVSIIKRIATKLGIQTKIVHDYPTYLTGTDRLIDLCLRYDCDTYLSGTGGNKYLEASKFDKAGLKLETQTGVNTNSVIDLL